MLHTDLRFFGFVALFTVVYSYEMRTVGVRYFAKDYSKDGTDMNEVSGLTSIPSTQTEEDSGEISIELLGVEDYLENDKPVWLFESTIEGFDANYSGNGKVGAKEVWTLNDIDDDLLSGDSLDTEDIAYFEDGAGNQYAAVSTEGHRTYDAVNHLFVYEIDSAVGDLTYVSELGFNPVYANTNASHGTDNNRGFEALDILNETLVFASEGSLIQDEDECDGRCVRISVNTLDTDNLFLTEDYQLLYELEDIPSDYNDNGLVAIAFIGDGTMNALCLERGYSASRFRFRIFVVDLSYAVASDVSNCAALSDCSGKTAIAKTKLFSMNDLDKTGDSWFDDYKKLYNFEALSRGVIQDKEHGGRFFVMASDNDGEGQYATYFVTLELSEDYFDTDNSVTAIGSMLAFVVSAFVSALIL